LEEILMPHPGLYVLHCIIKNRNYRPYWTLKWIWIILYHPSHTKAHVKTWSLKKINPTEYLGIWIVSFNL
jgi:hypothetical protein